VALCVFRVTQEALRNIGRHAAASRVHVIVRPEDGQIRLSVKDDGKGFDPGGQQAKPSLGLASMRQRIELLGGKLLIESSSNQGAAIFAWVPLQQKVGEDETSARIAG
jgi:signal transduction histidine kinase